MDNIFRHVIINGNSCSAGNENLRLRVGYNHLRRKELTIEYLQVWRDIVLEAVSKINAFKLDYGRDLSPCRRCYKSVSISTDLGKFFKHTLIFLTQIIHEKCVY
ncbi:MAG: hypothetical protein IPJ39_22160 [Saprospiraceae bacterium]|nr:hypothetical protein [Saprospiraceae bacterium]